ncbi:hypothetical protein [Synechocystis sp. PCC 7509]|uniref:hypothetical protein n=1 Tax=Synechocystis sp. PCC 7509 TaxID=927677 RepID=UPI0002ACCBDC|nr:hypothetical protein [Synechocystis sp. PCC 7509]
MLDLTNLSELSRTHCISLCAFLVPANLVATGLTMVLAALRRSKIRVWQSAGVASIFAVVLLWHVFTWFEVGVVMIPTYVLLWLSSGCLITNISAIAYRYSRLNRLSVIKERLISSLLF